MATIDKEMIAYLAKLSRIAVSEEDEESLMTDLAKILRYIEQLDEIDTSNTKPCTYLTPIVTQTPLRDDEIQNSLSREAFLKNSPSQVGGMIRVPPVLKPE